MVNPIAQVVGGVIGGFIAGIMGYTVDLMLGGILDAFGSVIPAIVLFGAIYGAVSFFIGISKASVAGIFFSTGIILAGWAVGDLVTGAGGVIALAVIVVMFFGHSSGD